MSDRMKESKLHSLIDIEIKSISNLILYDRTPCKEWELLERALTTYVRAHDLQLKISAENPIKPSALDIHLDGIRKLIAAYCMFRVGMDSEARIYLRNHIELMGTALEISYDDEQEALWNESTNPPDVNSGYPFGKMRSLERITKNERGIFNSDTVSHAQYLIDEWKKISTQHCHELCKFQVDSNVSEHGVRLFTDPNPTIKRHQILQLTALISNGIKTLVNIPGYQELIDSSEDEDVLKKKSWILSSDASIAQELDKVKDEFGDDESDKLMEDSTISINHNGEIMSRSFKNISTTVELEGIFHHKSDDYQARIVINPKSNITIYLHIGDQVGQVDLEVVSESDTIGDILPSIVSKFENLANQRPKN